MNVRNIRTVSIIPLEAKQMHHYVHTITNIHVVENSKEKGVLRKARSMEIRTSRVLSIIHVNRKILSVLPVDAMQYWKNNTIPRS